MKNIEVTMNKLSDTTTRKFTDIIDTDDWLIETDTGWQPIIDIKQTVGYDVYRIELTNGMSLNCADTHIIFDSEMNELYVRDGVKNQLVQTKSGTAHISSVVATGEHVPMYDIGVDSTDHRYYTGGILSHNTTTAAGYLLREAMFKSDQTILIAAHKFLGAQEIMQRIRFAYENCPDFIRAGVTSYNKGSIEFDNGSRIVAQTTTENTGRGMAISLLYCDEMAFLRPSIAKEFYTAIAPTLSTGGRMIVTSTPNTDEDQFAQIWFDATNTFDEFGNDTRLGKNGFKSFTCHWTEHPDRGEEWGNDMRAKLGDEKFEREIECRFVGADETLIDSMKLANMKGVEPIEKHGQVRWYKKPSKNCTYMIGLDPSLGTGSDPAAIQVFEMPGLTQVAEWSHNKTAIQKQVKIMQEICKYLADITGSNNVYYSVENNTLGEAALVAISEIGEENFHGTFLSQPKKLGGTKGRKGFTVSHRSKLTACAKFKSLVERGKLTINSKLLMSELKTFVSCGQSFEAKSGTHDDLVMATLLVVTMLTSMQEYDSSLDSEMRDADESYVMPMPFIMC